MSDNTLQTDRDTGEVHYRCGGVLRWELQPRTLNLQTSFRVRIYWVDEPDWMTRCDRCGLVGIPVEPTNA